VNGGCPVERLLRPATAWALASLVLMLAVALIPLALTAGQNPLVTVGPQIAIVVSFAITSISRVRTFAIESVQPWPPYSAGRARFSFLVLARACHLPGGGAAFVDAALKCGEPLAGRHR